MSKLIIKIFCITFILLPQKRRVKSRKSALMRQSNQFAKLKKAKLEKLSEREKLARQVLKEINKRNRSIHLQYPGDSHDFTISSFTSNTIRSTNRSESHSILVSLNAVSGNFTRTNFIPMR